MYAPVNHPVSQSRAFTRACCAASFVACAACTVTSFVFSAACCAGFPPSSFFSSGALSGGGFPAGGLGGVVSCALAIATVRKRIAKRKKLRPRLRSQRRLAGEHTIVSFSSLLL